MSIELLRAGVLTTVQDLGRHRARHLGVGTAGALDAWSAQVANLLVGNPPGAALLEITLSGPALRIHRTTSIAITGADIDATLDGRALPGWRRIDLPKGAEIRFGGCRRGSRACLALRGGLLVPELLGSRSTDLRAGFGGVEGRALRAGDRIALGFDPRQSSADLDAPRIARRWIDPLPDLDLAHDAVARVLPGRDAIDPADALVRATWQVDPRSDRQGLRLSGPRLRLRAPREPVSEPVVPGTIQLPPDGQPIVLLADAQTCGGYPRIGQVAAADLPRLAQCRAGDAVHFLSCTPSQALGALQAQRARLQRIALALESARD